ncbi:MAG: V-type ATP synthase subunit K [Clostridiales bacterium]|nr:V-type ATP synthase subunit K [Clostridia bacterium]MCD8002971.1 V-type ATP synthase subunit K [Clostridia bacterium]MCD8056130.1 V-type ATP synthase subunit K [Clostridiales bacterium]
MQFGTFSEFLSQINGVTLAMIGAAVAALLPGLGSAKAVRNVGVASSAILAEDPSKFGSTLLLQALPGTQGIYGLVTAFLVMFKIGVLGDLSTLETWQGAFYLVACLPIAVVGYFSAVYQAKVCVSGVNLLSKRPGEVGKAITSAALVETYAILALLISLIPVLFASFS